MALADVPLWQRGISLLGLFTMIGLAWAMSYDRKGFPRRVVAWGVGLQLVFGVIVLRTSVGRAFFEILNDAALRLLTFTEEGSRFLFGAYLDDHFTMALNVLPTILFFSALMTVLYHLGVMQHIVRGFAWVMQRTMKTSGAETLSAAANIFVGQTEAPLVVKPFVATMTQSELMAVMVGGFANVAGGVMAAYVGMLQGSFPDIAGHLMASSVMSAPASLLLAKVILPEKEVPKTATTLELTDEKPHANVIDAAAAGASEGLSLALNVAAMLVAFMALVAMVNWLLGVPSLWHDRALWAEALAAYAREGVAVPEACAGTDLDVSTLASVLATGERGGPHARRRVGADHHAAHPRLRRLADHLHDGRALRRLSDGVVDPRSASRAQRVRRLRVPRREPRERAPDEPARGGHRELCAVRLRELQLGRHPARRHRAHWRRSAGKTSRGSASARCSAACSRRT